MDLGQQLRLTFQRLDDLLAAENRDRRAAGGSLLDRVKIRILGQTALLLANLPFPLAGTMDLDATVQGGSWPQKRLGEILLTQGLRLDTDSHLIWIPKNSQFRLWFEGIRVKALLIEPDAVVASKARARRPKDKALVRTYLESYPTAAARLKEWGVSYQWVQE